ncbi:hypothetical protein CDAR_114471 [Caerostris darwini]|uniref:Uncharacterized protein n=1 Tax=Caerostris darwini TaxID=1538125 RepID=A0AAV4NHY6_9ARAC|nr:hypothetical protein CDAR_114471 [Caerostris darwini]
MLQNYRKLKTRKKSKREKRTSSKEAAPPTEGRSSYCHQKRVGRALTSYCFMFFPLVFPCQAFATRLLVCVSLLDASQQSRVTAPIHQTSAGNLEEDPPLPIRLDMFSLDSPDVATNMDLDNDQQLTKAYAPSEN